MRALGFVGDGARLVRALPARPGAERICARFEACGERMVLQAAGAAPVPWEAALEALLTRLRGRRLDWWLTGSAALAVRGVEVEPRDVDLVTDASGAAAIADLLADALVEPLSPGGWLAGWWGRAFLHARIEWVGDVHPAHDDPEPVDYGPVAAARLETVDWNGFAVRVPPFALQLRAAERRGLEARAAAIRRAGSGA